MPCRDAPCACAIPGTAKKLSGNQNVVFTIATGQSNLIGITLDGIANFGSARYRMPRRRCLGRWRRAFRWRSATRRFSTLAFSASMPTRTTFSAPAPRRRPWLRDDAIDLPVTATPSPAVPNRFTLTPASAAVGNKVVHLTAGSTPLAGSGGVAVTAHANGNLRSGVRHDHANFRRAWQASSTRMPLRPVCDGICGSPKPALRSIGRITTTGTITEFSNGLDQVRGLESYSRCGRSCGSRSTLARSAGLRTAGVVTEFPVAASAPGFGIAVGSDGTLWFGDECADKIHRMTTAGVVTSFSTGLSNGINDLTEGPDGNVWFTEGDRFGKITTGRYDHRVFDCGLRRRRRLRHLERSGWNPLVRRSVGKCDRADHDRRRYHANDGWLDAAERADVHCHRRRRQRLVHRGQRRQSDRPASLRQAPSRSSPG